MPKPNSQRVVKNLTAFCNTCHQSYDRDPAADGIRISRSGFLPDYELISWITLFGGMEDADLLNLYRHIGLAWVVTTLPPEPADKMLPELIAGPN